MASSDIEVDLDEVQEAAKRVAQYINRTPVMTSSTLDSMAGRSLHFKCELFQKTGSFKVSSWLYGRLSDGMFHFFSGTPPTLRMSRFLPPHGFVGTLWKNLSHPPSFFVGSFQNGFLQVVCQGYSSIGWGQNKNGMYVPIHRQISDMTTATNF